MAVFKINKTSNYTVMSNHHLQEKEMSLKAKGLLSVMLSLPENWDYSISGLVAICKESETAINSTLKELKELGYLKVGKKMPNETNSGRIEYIYNIYEIPQKQGVEKQALEKQGVENQGVEFQGVENQGQLNTNNTITKELNTNNKILCVETDIINYLNEKAGTRFKPIEGNTKFIKARLKDYTEEDLKSVIDKKVKEWKGTDFQKYLRPETLFNATKFESYVNGLENGDKANNKNTALIRQREYPKEVLDNVFQNIDDLI